jgi:hypothetical protein
VPHQADRGGSRSVLSLQEVSWRWAIPEAVALRCSRVVKQGECGVRYARRVGADADTSKRQGVAVCDARRGWDPDGVAETGRPAVGGVSTTTPSAAHLPRTHVWTPAQRASHMFLYETPFAAQTGSRVISHLQRRRAASTGGGTAGPVVSHTPGLMACAPVQRASHRLRNCRRSPIVGAQAQTGSASAGQGQRGGSTAGAAVGWGARRSVGQRGREFDRGAAVTGTAQPRVRA